MSSSKNKPSRVRLKGLGTEGFLTEYWQQKPLVIRQGMEQFSDPLSADELAGLAAEDVVESRLIYKKNKQWQALHGPVTDYSEYGEQDWTLVVQSVNHWEPEAAKLIRAFDFLPRWRLDDVMISFAVKGGSVGPHIDQYDTFIIQGSGSRRWRVGHPGKHHSVIPHPALKHIEDFESDIDVTLDCGDVLYIPPGFPHEGISLEPSMSFSVGYRAPTDSELVSGLADYLSDSQRDSTFLTDSRRPPTHHCGAISEADISRIRSLLQNILGDTELLSDFAACYLSQENRQLDDLAPSQPMSSKQLLEALQAGQVLYRLGGLRCFYLQKRPQKNNKPGSNTAAHIYIQGERFELPDDCQHAIQFLCDQDSIDGNQLGVATEIPEFIDFLADQLNRGHWYFDNSQ